jgi:uncharacterized protein YciI
MSLKVFPYLILILICSACEESVQSSQKIEVQILEEGIAHFDSTAAKKYGADEYGMRKYVMAFLKKGPNRDQDSTLAVQLQAAHLKNIGRLAKEGKLALAGPFFGNDDLRGIYIFAVESIEEAEALTKTDPAIQAGRLVMELKEWYGSAAIMAINEIHNTLSEQNIME